MLPSNILSVENIKASILKHIGSTAEPLTWQGSNFTVHCIQAYLRNEADQLQGRDFIFHIESLLKRKWGVCDFSDFDLSISKMKLFVTNIFKSDNAQWAAQCPEVTDAINFAGRLISHLCHVNGIKRVWPPITKWYIKSSINIISIILWTTYFKMSCWSFYCSLRHDLFMFSFVLPSKQFGTGC